MSYFDIVESGNYVCKAPLGREIFEMGGKMFVVDYERESFSEISDDFLKDWFHAKYKTQQQTLLFK